MEKILIIGGGQSAFQTAASLRQSGYNGAITIVSKERQLPYQRPPLSKGFLRGSVDEAQLHFRPASWYRTHEISVYLEAEASFIDRHNQRVVLRSGDNVPYDKLILATGSVPKRLPGVSCSSNQVLCLSTVDDAVAVKDTLSSARRMAVIGGGFLGLEVAASARELGKDVFVVEADSRVLARVAGPLVSEYLTRLHRSHGVEFLIGATPTAIGTGNGALIGVTMSNGEEIAVDLAIIAIGSSPNVQLAEEAGLLCDGGIIVDEGSRTSDPNIFAAGDCCRRKSPGNKYLARLESVHNAVEQSRVIAACITNREPQNLEVPWFWTDQFDAKIQIAGLRLTADEYVVKGEACGHHFSVLYFNNRTLVAVEAVNSPDDFLIGRKLIGKKANFDPRRITSDKDSLKAFLSG